MNIYVDNDNVLTLDELTDIVLDDFVNDATVTARLKGPDGIQIGSNINLGYIPASNGKYRGLIDDTHALEIRKRVTLEIEVNASGGRKGLWTVSALSTTRSE
jgi:hypothetical protein